MWQPDRPWTEVRCERLAAAFSPHAGVADEYLGRVEDFLETGDPHCRTQPFSTTSADWPGMTPRQTPRWIAPPTCCAVAELRLNPYIDTMLALRLSVESHR